MDLEGEMESDGNIAYKVTLVAREMLLWRM